MRSCVVRTQLFRRLVPFRHYSLVSYAVQQQQQLNHLVNHYSTQGTIKSHSDTMAPIVPDTKTRPTFLPADAKVVIVTDGVHDDIAKVDSILAPHGANAAVVNARGHPNSIALLASVDRVAFPLVFIKGDCIGGVDDLAQLERSGVLGEWLKDHQYDLIVIGGGSGGLAAAKEAAGFGKKVACLDFVKPTPIGTSWGLGGTCVNVGCIPKKLMHTAALLGHHLTDASYYGWTVPTAKNEEGDDNIHHTLQHQWATMRGGIQDYIGSLNWGYRVALREKTVTYINSFGSFVNSHTIRAVNKRGKEELITGDRFLIATGLRPRYLDVPGARELCITSDDLFSLDAAPGKTLCVGASYVSLECAGFLQGIGFDTTVMVRSILLRGFDQDMAERVGAQMLEQGVKFVRGHVPTKFERLNGPTGRITVTATNDAGDAITEEYDTVVLAIGRDALTDDLNLASVGVQTNKENKKLVCRANEQSVSTPWVYGIGDVLDGKPELTPVAVQAGRFLMRRLYAESTTLANYINVPTTVFTPLEYGAIGMSEEAAIKKYGEDNIEVYHNVFNPLEHTVAKSKDAKHCYAKLMRVLGLHYLGPNAGEVTQGYGGMFLFSPTKDHFDQLIGIHPTTAEVFTTMTTTKRGPPLQAAGC